MFTNEWRITLLLTLAIICQLYKMKFIQFFVLCLFVEVRKRINKNTRQIPLGPILCRHLQINLLILHLFVLGAIEQIVI